MILFLLLIGLVSTSCAKKESRVVEMFTGIKLPEVNESLSAKNVRTSYIRVPVDHFDLQNFATFPLRFMYNEQFFGGDGYPIFIFIGGDWEVFPIWLNRGIMYAMARENKGYQVLVEHRYFGESHFFKELPTENLRFLNVNQALADLAYFIGEMKKQPHFANSKVILYGAAYAGKLAMWFKKRYPHLAVGSVASSAAILAKVDFSEYLEVVHEAFLLEGGEQCIAHIRQGIDETVIALQTESGIRMIEQVYSLCDRIEDDLDKGQFSGIIAWTFARVVMNSRPGDLRNICNNFGNNSYGATPMQQIAGFIAGGANVSYTCWVTSFESVIKEGFMERLSSRAGVYQTCTEFGYFTTAPKSGTVFDDLTWLNIDFYTEICLRAFDKRFDKDFLHGAVDRVNLAFGGLEPKVNNVINIHGYYDPWRALGVYKENISESSPTFTVNRASHCFDLLDWEYNDETAEMIAVQQEVRRIVTSWLSD